MAQMTFLEMVQRAWRESGLVSTTPPSVLNQTGRAADMVDWVKDAYEDIEARSADWNWNWAQGTFALAIGDDTYDPVNDFGVVGGVRDFARKDYASYTYPTAQGVNGRSFMKCVTWEQFQGLQIPPVTGSVPTIFTLRPDGDVQYYPVPNVAVTVVHEYWRNPQTLAADEDVLRIPAKFHMAVVWAAVMKGCGKTQNFARWDTAEEEFNKLLRAMERECLPRMMLGAPLA